MGTLSKVRELCDLRNVAISRLEKDCGFANASLAGLKKEDVPFERVVMIAKYFGVSLDYFCDDNIQVDRGEQELLSIFNSFNDEGRDKLINYARDLRDAGRYIKNHKYEMVGNGA